MSMWVVVDTNQARRLPIALRSGPENQPAAGLSLSPFLLAEILLRGEQPTRETLAALQRHNYRIGMQPSEMLDLVAITPAAGVAALSPFPSSDSELAALSRMLFDERHGAAARGWAEKVKASHLALCGHLETLAALARTRLRRLKVERLLDFSAALEGLATGPDSFLPSLVNRTVRNNGGRSVVESDPDVLYRAVMANPYLRRYFHGLLYYIVSISRFWGNQLLNRDPSSKRDDWTDVAIGLYVGDGDLVASNDALVRQLFEAIDPSVRVLDAGRL
jgi:hypothetical protein